MGQRAWSGVNSMAAMPEMPRTTRSFREELRAATCGNVSGAGALAELSQMVVVVVRGAWHREAQRAHLPAQVIVWSYMTNTARALSVLCLTGTLLASAATAHAAPPPDPTVVRVETGSVPGILSKGAKFGLGTAALGVLLGPVGIAAGALGGAAPGGGAAPQ